MPTFCRQFTESLSRRKSSGLSAKESNTIAPKNKKDAHRSGKKTTRIRVKLNKGTDAGILERLEQVPSKQGYIKRLIRADIAKHA